MPDSKKELLSAFASALPRTQHPPPIDMDSELNNSEKSPSRKELAIRLGVIQRKAAELGIPAVVMIEGLDGSGKGLLLNKLILEIDSRAYGIYSTHAGDPQTMCYPLLWPAWVHTPEDGKLQFFDRSPYYLALDGWAEGHYSEGQLERFADDFRHFEKQLADNGTLILKVFLSVSKKEQSRRFRKLEKNPKTAWRVTPKDWRRHGQHKAFLEQTRALMAATDAPHAPWKEIQTDDLRGASIELYETVITAFEQAVAERKTADKKPKPRRFWVSFQGPDHLSRVDLSAELERREYKKLLKQRQAEIYDLAHQIHEHQIPVVMPYCGWDAAGKGGCIKRLLQGVDPRSFTVVPVGAPSKLELRHHYLWRFWTRIPPRGKITIFDRSWYGRVLVERVEALCSNAEWQRAYQEMNMMERHLTDAGAVLIKFWLHIDEQTQLERFQARAENPFKKWKITDEDWRNRKKFHRYKEAVNEMIERTDTPYAPWTIVSANCKMHARIQTLDTFIAAVKKALEKQ
jgi:polyphosphate:AMP phosphotransferase